MTQAIEQATCESCTEEENEFRVTNKKMFSEYNIIAFNAECSCGSDGIVTIDGHGTHAGRGINHDDASWNTEQSDDA